MAIGRFEDIFGWQKGQELALQVYSFTKDLRDFAFRDQIRRSVISISSNIAEGFDRQSNKEFIRFLYFALGSCSETKSLLYLARKLDYINPDKETELLLLTEEIGRILHGLINSMKRE